MSKPRFKIVLADDNVVVLKVLSLKLAALGFEVVTIAESDQIIPRVTEERPNLIVLDQHFGYQASISSPEWSGLKILRWMNRLESLRDIPIIIVTADESPQLKADAMKFGASAFLQKPLDHEQLVRLCVSLCGVSRPGHHADGDPGVSAPLITAANSDTSESAAQPPAEIKLLF